MPAIMRRKLEAIWLIDFLPPLFWCRGTVRLADQLLDLGIELLDRLADDDLDLRAVILDAKDSRRLFDALEINLVLIDGIDAKPCRAVVKVADVLLAPKVLDDVLCCFLVVLGCHAVPLCPSLSGFAFTQI